MFRALGKFRVAAMAAALAATAFATAGAIELPTTAAAHLVMHLKSDAGIVLDGLTGDVQIWTDQSGVNGSNNAVQSTGGIQPSLVPNVLFSKPVIRFSAAELDFMNLDSAGTLGIQNSPYEMFFVARTSSTAVQFLVSGSSDHYEIHLNGSAGQRYIPGTYSGAESSDIGSAGDYANGQMHIFSVRMDPTADYRGVSRVDGADSTDWTFSDARRDVNATMFLGKRHRNEYYFNGDFAEVLVYNTALAGDQRQAVEQYLTDRWIAPSYVASTGRLYYQSTDTSGNALVPTQLPDGTPNLALDSSIATAFAKDLIGGGAYSVHQIPHLNDGKYGNSFSWIGDSTGTYAGIWFNTPVEVTALAFGRDNILDYGGKPYTDRASGTYDIQYTTDSLAGLDMADPDDVASLTWQSLGTVFVPVGDGLSPYNVDDPDGRRKLFTVDSPVELTALRIMSPHSSTAIDEIEIYGTVIPEPSSVLLFTLALAGLAGVRGRRRR